MNMENHIKDVVDGYTFIAKILKKLQTEIIYGIVGIPITQLAHAAQKEKIKYIGMRNEQAAGYAAAAYGYLTSKPGICLTVSGPGFVHGLAGLSHATANCFPMILLSGSCPVSVIGKGGFQECDQISMARLHAKAVYKIENLSSAGEILTEAIETAIAGKPGGVYVDLPANMLHELISYDKAESLIEKVLFKQSEKMVSTKNDFEKAVDMIKSAKNPLIVIGKGAAYSNSEIQIKDFIEQYEIPFLATPMGKGVLSDKHELSAGAARSYALSKTDCAIIIGARLNWILHFGETPKWSNECKFIQIDISNSDVDKFDVSLLGDAIEVVPGLHKELNKTNIKKTTKWVSEIQNKTAMATSKLEARLQKFTCPMNHYSAFRIIRDKLADYPETIISTEGANTMDIGRITIPIQYPRKTS